MFHNLASSTHHYGIGNYIGGLVTLIMIVGVCWIVLSLAAKLLRSVGIMGKKNNS